MSKFSTESIALGATLIAQAKGEITAARHAAQGAVQWLRAIDPAYKPTVEVRSADPEVDPIDGDVRRAEANPVVINTAIEDANKRAAAAEARAAEATSALTEIRDAIPPAILTRADGDTATAISLLVALADRAARQAPAVVQAPAPAPTPTPTPTPVKAIPNPPAAPVKAPAADFDPAIHVPAEARSNATAVAFYRSQWERGWRPKP